MEKCHCYRRLWRARCIAEYYSVSRELTFNQGVDGSIPSGLTNHFKRLQPDPGEAMAIFACKTTTGSIEVTERGHGEVAILVDELGEVTAIDLPAERAAALAKAILAHVGQER